MSSDRPRVVLADDHRLVAEGLQRLLQDECDLVACVASGTALLDAVRQHAPDLVVSDLAMPDRNGLSVVRELREQGIDVPFVFLTMHAEPALAEQAFRAGASAYVLKSSAGEELLRAIHAVRSGRTYITPTLAAHVIAAPARGRQHVLTDKQRQVLQLVCAGLRSKQVAAELGVSVRTVESHRYAIMQALDVHSTVELVRKAEEYGLTPAPHELRPLA
ncbi:response regulator transcription factor [Lysobacter sp. TY2-98]|uniref:response regulator n=1 Tax=Lysobacter sp. TY2-98 TaxID=2290922 RepID=UPI001F07F372|nr:response regulator transcription factor [Lysobacter sp. TY2-98]